MGEEPKMKGYEAILEVVQRLRKSEEQQRLLGKEIRAQQETLEDLGVRCNNVTNCVDVGIKCYKCKNNFARRSYFRDLLVRTPAGEIAAIYAADASSFEAIE